MPTQYSFRSRAFQLVPWPLGTFFCWRLLKLGHENIWLKKKSLNIEQIMSFGNLGHSVAFLPPDEDKFSRGGFCPTSDAILWHQDQVAAHIAFPHYIRAGGQPGIFPGACPLLKPSSWWLLDGPGLPVTFVSTYCHPHPHPRVSVLPYPPQLSHPRPGDYSWHPLSSCEP